MVAGIWGQTRNLEGNLLLTAQAERVAGTSNRPAAARGRRAPGMVLSAIPFRGCADCTGSRWRGYRARRALTQATLVAQASGLLRPWN